MLSSRRVASLMSKLQDQLDQITANTRNLVQPERLEISERAVAELYAAGVEDRILQVGARAPEFALPDAAGRIVRSSDLLALGPLVINFFVAAGAPTALLSSSPGVICILRCVSAGRC